ncbi:hypothetical protein ACQKFM_28830 [Paenibacillus xylanexedens]
MSDMNHNNNNEHPDFNEISGEENILVRGAAFSILVDINKLMVQHPR